MAAWSLTRVTTIRRVDGVEDWFAVIKDGLVQLVVDPATSLAVAGFIIVRAGRTSGGNLFAGISSKPALVALPNDIASTVWGYVLQPASVITTPTSVQGDFALTENGVEVKRYRLRAFEDAGSPVGYGWSMASV
jgi:hypothetical protein